MVKCSACLFDCYYCCLSGTNSLALLHLLIWAFGGYWYFGQHFPMTDCLTREKKCINFEIDIYDSQYTQSKVGYEQVSAIFSSIKRKEKKKTGKESKIYGLVRLFM